MKKKIIRSSIIIVLFALIISTSGFFTLVNIKEIDTTKDILSTYNLLLSKTENIKLEDLKSFKINESTVRFTLINKAGDVIFDSFGENLENHIDREEVSTAFSEGESRVTRVSETQGVQLVYVATKIDDNYVIRSSLPVSNVNIFTEKYIIYYGLLILGVIILSIILSLKLVRAIIYPVRELEGVTSKIASGDLSKRARIRNDNEIGSLARTFNYMADELEMKIQDSQDKGNKLECILESMDNGVIAIDSKNNVMMINPYAKKIFGIKSDIIGKQIGDFISDARILDFIIEIPVINKKEIKIKSPVERILKLKKAPIIQERSYPMGSVIVVTDITEVKQLESMRSQFVANVSHELKTPLTSIKGFAETLKYVDDNDTRMKFLGIIDKEAERLTRLINDILILSNIENCESMSGDEFTTDHIIRHVLDMVEVQAKKNNIEVILETSYDGKLSGNKDRFYQLVINLVENGIKYAGEGSKVIIRSYNSGDNFILEVQDNGQGIPAEDLPRIFERFYRVDKARGSTGVSGTGLGLAIVKHIVKLFQGDIVVNSEVGVGTTFKVKFKRIK